MHVCMYVCKEMNSYNILMYLYVLVFIVFGGTVVIMVIGCMCCWQTLKLKAQTSTLCNFLFMEIQMQTSLKYKIVFSISFIQFSFSQSIAFISINGISFRLAANADCILSIPPSFHCLISSSIYFSLILLVFFTYMCVFVL